MECLGSQHGETLVYVSVASCELSDSFVHDSPLLSLGAFPRLHTLKLANNRITDEGVSYVMGKAHEMKVWNDSMEPLTLTPVLGQLLELDVSGNDVTALSDPPIRLILGHPLPGEWCKSVSE